MDCIECKTANPDSNRFCGQCGAELGRTLEETVRKKGFRDRHATEMEITEAVVERLMKWGRWLGGIAALIVALIAFGVGLIYHDTRAVLDAGKIQIESAVADGKSNISSAVAQGKNSVADATKDIDRIRQKASDLGTQVGHLQADINGYKEVNGEMRDLQKQFHGQTEDLSKLNLRVHSLETVAIPGEPSQMALGTLGCQPSPRNKGFQLVICAQGSPPVLYQRPSTGDLRPISSLSPVGFQDTSTGPRPLCTAVSRGTFYVEKEGREADKPILCAKKRDNTYDWIQLGMP
jgi:hypothetical protein